MLLTYPLELPPLCFQDEFVQHTAECEPVDSFLHELLRTASTLWSNKLMAGKERPFLRDHEIEIT